MRRFLTMVIVSGTVMSALALAMTAEPTIARHMYRVPPIFSLTATPMWASAPVRRILTMTVIRQHKPEQPEPGILVRWPDGAGGDRLTDLPAPCAFGLTRTAPACFFTVSPNAATPIDHADIGTAPDGANPAVGATPGRIGQAGNPGSFS